MGLDNVSQRITTNELLIQYLPCGIAQVHTQRLDFNGAVTAGTFKLRVNGELTAAITFDDTVATLITSITTALTALPNLIATSIVPSGTKVEEMLLTSGESEFYAITVEEDALTGNTSDDANVVTYVTQQGGRLYTLSGEMSDFDWEVSIEDTDVTPINQVERQKIAVATMASFNIMLYRTVTSAFRYAMYEGAEGWIYVYPRGKITGREFLIMPVILDSYKEKYPDHEKVDVTIAGTRQGAWVVPPNSIFR